MTDQERRRFIRLDVSEDVSALDSEGRHIGKVELVSGGGMQIRLSPESPAHRLEIGTQLAITVIETGGVQETMEVEVRDRIGDILGVRFLTKPS